MTTTVGKTLQDLLITPVKEISLSSLSNPYKATIAWKEHVPVIHCMDGTQLSVQASSNNYCTPKNNDGPWISVEVGYPSKHLPQLDDYKDGEPEDDPTECVYGYVPIEVVEDAIASCGGICWEWTILNDEKASSKP